MAKLNVSLINGDSCQGEYDEYAAVIALLNVDSTGNLYIRTHHHHSSLLALADDRVVVTDNRVKAAEV